ncbi:unnamed protein product [Rhizoctonia solani]|uniref:Uncharacterized protein n=1 Tax=Rhizoctonia solani TaxID=456999 RepID=A0A8H3AXX0_9AGAM|nr:unnamed protein product [Rhizoctonia solani]
MPLSRDPQDDSRTNMQLSAPSWASSSSFATSPRRPFAISDTPSSPASSTASQKFEVKRLLSRPADPASCSRPLTLVAPTTGSSTIASDLQPTVKRSNSLGKGFLKRRPSRTQDDAGATPKARHAPLDDEPIPSMPSFTLPDSAVPPSTTTPASAYARAYAQRTQMSTGVDSHLPASSADRERLPPRPRARSKSRPRAPSEPAEGRTRHPLEGLGPGRIVAVGDPFDETLALSLNAPALALAGAGPASVPRKPSEPDSFGRGLTRKVSARFRRRKNSNPGAGIMSDGEADMPIRSQSRRRDTGKDKESHMPDWKEWEAGRQDWSREKERVGLRGIGLTGIALGSNTRSPVLSAQSSSSSSPRLVDQDATMRVGRRKRLSRHLSIEDFRSLVPAEQQTGATFEMWDPKPAESRPQVGPEADKSAERKRANSISRKERTRRDLAAVQEKERERQMAATVGRSGIKDIPMARTESQPPLFRKDDLHTVYIESSPTPSLRGEPSSKRSTMIRSDSMPSESSRPTGITSPESRKENKIWRLVKKMSTGTLKEKKSYQTEKAPPVPPLPTSRRSSVYDYGEEVRADLARFGTPRTSIGREASSTAGSVHSGPSSLSGHATITNSPQATSQPYRNRSASSGRPSLSHEWRPSMTNDSAPSSSPKSSFGRAQSPRTSMSSYVDIGEEVPPLPLGKHIVPPNELAQQYIPREREPLATSNNNTGVGASPSLPPPKRPRAAQKSRDKSVTPLSSPALSNATQPPKSKPNVLRRPTRLNDDGLSIPSPRPASTASPRSPRSASMGMPSPRPRAQTQTQDQLPPRPRSNSLGTVFTFRELGKTETRSKLTEQEKVAKFEQLLEASDKAGGTLHARLNDRALLSDTISLSGNFDGASVVSEL